MRATKNNKLVTKYLGKTKTNLLTLAPSFQKTVQKFAGFWLISRQCSNSIRKRDIVLLKAEKTVLIEYLSV